jgi:hypothetical protein
VPDSTSQELPVMSLVTKVTPNIVTRATQVLSTSEVIREDYRQELGTKNTGKKLIKQRFKKY